MNVKAMQWLQLAAFLKERERQFGARVKGSPVSMQELPPKINDPEVSHFLEARIEQTLRILQRFLWTLAFRGLPNRSSNVAVGGLAG